MLFLGTFTKVCDQCSCGLNDKRDRKEGLCLYDCKKRCASDATCRGIEYWPGSKNNAQKVCFKCSHPELASTKLSIFVPAFKPFVYKKDNKGITSLMQ